MRTSCVGFKTHYVGFVILPKRNRKWSMSTAHLEPISGTISGYMNLILMDHLKLFNESILESTYIKIQRYMNCVYFNQLYIIYIFCDK